MEAWHSNPQTSSEQNAVQSQYTAGDMSCLVETSLKTTRLGVIKVKAVSPLTHQPSNSVKQQALGVSLNHRLQDDDPPSTDDRLCALLPLDVGGMAEFNQRSLVAADAAEIVSQIIRARQTRATFFGSELFADPAWDIMLELFLAQLTQRRLASSDLGFRTPVPMSTALRWVDKLSDGGWIRRTRDPSDYRRTLVELSAQGSTAMQAWINELADHQPKPAGDGRVQDLLSRLEQGRREL